MARACEIVAASYATYLVGIGGRVREKSGAGGKKGADRQEVAESRAVGMNKPRAPNAGNAGLHEAWWNRDERGCRRSGNSD